MIGILIVCALLIFENFIISKEINELREFNRVQIKLNEKQTGINSEILCFRDEAQEMLRTQDGIIEEIIRHTDGLEDK